LIATENTARGHVAGSLHPTQPEQVSRRTRAEGYDNEERCFVLKGYYFLGNTPPNRNAII